MTEIPKPASPLPWTRDYEISFGAPYSGDCLIYGHGESGIVPEEADEAYIVWAANNAPALYEALTHPQHGDIAKMLEMAADLIDKGVGPGWETFFTPHLHRPRPHRHAAIDRGATGGDGGAGAV